MMKKPLPFNNQKQLRDSIYEYIQKKNIKKNNHLKKINFVEDEILINPIDYYYTNAVARASKTMSECRKINFEIKKTG